MAKKETKPTTTAKPKADPMANPSTEQFKAIVKAYLDKRAEQDELFKATYAKPNKSIDECVKYIIGEVYKAGKIGHANMDIWNLAIHYYDEDDIKITPVPANCYGVGVVHTMGEDGRPMRPARPKAPSAPAKGKGTPKPTTPSKPTTTPPKSTTPPKATPSKPSESKPSTTANKPHYTANLFDLWQKD
jgi:hypothetical protein